MTKHLRSLGAYALLLLGGLALGYAVPRIPEWFKPAYIEGDYSAYLANAQSKVVLYGTKWCPYCAKTKAYFAEHNIQYEELDIENSALAQQQFKQLAGGGTIPKVIIGNRMIVGFVPDAFEAALKNLVPAK